MTTIAYRDGVIASDSQVTSGGGTIASLDTPKVYSHNGNTIGVCGLYGDNILYKKWVENGMEGDCPDTKDNETGALLLTSDGQLFGIWENQLMVPLDVEYCAIGSGTDVALGAMHMGATAIQAVEAAIKHNAFTGGKVFSFSAKDKIASLKKASG